MVAGQRKRRRMAGNELGLRLITKEKMDMRRKGRLLRMTGQDGENEKKNGIGGI